MSGDMTAIDDILNQFFLLGKLFKYVNMNFEDIYRAYFVKNLLNEFRQKNGYKKGTYQKIWKTDLGNGIQEYEDNQVAYHFAKNISLENIDTELLKRLNEVYKKIKKEKQ